MTLFFLPAIPGAPFFLDFSPHSCHTKFKSFKKARFFPKRGVRFMAIKRIVRVFILGCFFLTPLRAGTYSGGGDGSPENPFQLATVTDLVNLSTASADWGSCFILANDIHIMTAAFNQAVIAPDTDNTNMSFEGTAFTGRFDGRGFKIMNLTIHTLNTGNDYLGFIGSIATGAVVENLTLENVKITGGQDSFYLGGLAGLSAGTIRNCRTIGTITCTGDHTLCAGGLVGSNSANIEACSALVNLTIQGDSYGIGGLVGENSTTSATIHKCFATGNVTVWDLSYYIGGLVGDNFWGNIDHSYAAGKVSGPYYYLRQVGGLAGRNRLGIVQNCFSTGRVDASYSTEVGGFLGYSSGGTVTSCFWDKDTSQQAGSAGGTGVQGKTTTEMKTRATFTAVAWDFLGETANGTADIWRMCTDLVDYPQLSWVLAQNGDLDCPDGVALEDLIYLAGRWLADTASLAGTADINGDAAVDLCDFALLARHWLEDA